MKTYIGLALCFIPVTLRAQDHGHLNVGAVSQTQAAKLTFDNGVDFSGNYVKTLTYTNAGKFANLYQGNITLTALHSTNAFGEPVPNAPAPGAFIIAEIVSVHGPEGGAFQFWDADSTIAPTHNIPVGTTNGNFRFDLSESALGAGEPGGDPFGHIHGRRFTVTKPGLYNVEFRAWDISTNGTGGGPIHLPSDLRSVYFQGDVNITEILSEGENFHVTVGAMSGYIWQVQSKETFSEQQWTDVGVPITGVDHLYEVLDERPAGSTRFYRAVGTPVIP